MNSKNLYEVFRVYEGQPVKIYTDDEKVHCGIDLNAYEDAVRIIDKCGRLTLIEYSHIASVVEPMMELEMCCRSRCNCRDEREYEREDERHCR